MKPFFRLLVFCVAVLVSSFVMTQPAEAGGRGGFRKGPLKPPPKPVYTAIASVDPTAMTITTEAKNTPSAATKTYKISPRTKITVNGRDGTVADLKPGLQIRVGAGMDADVAEELSAQNPPPDPKGPAHGRDR